MRQKYADSQLNSNFISIQYVKSVQCSLLSFGFEWRKKANGFFPISSTNCKRWFVCCLIKIVLLFLSLVDLFFLFFFKYSLICPLVRHRYRIPTLYSMTIRKCVHGKLKCIVHEEIITTIKTMSDIDMQFVSFLPSIQQQQKISEVITVYNTQEVVEYQY